jgi:hypothetical protein
VRVALHLGGSLPDAFEFAGLILDADILEDVSDLK